jgi:hypothetical protein
VAAAPPPGSRTAECAAARSDGQRAGGWASRWASRRRATAGGYGWQLGGAVQYAGAPRLRGGVAPEGGGSAGSEEPQTDQEAHEEPRGAGQALRGGREGVRRRLGGRRPRAATARRPKAQRGRPKRARRAWLSTTRPFLTAALASSASSRLRGAGAAWASWGRGSRGVRALEHGAVQRRSGARGQRTRMPTCVRRARAPTPRHARGALRHCALPPGPCRPPMRPRLVVIAHNMARRCERAAIRRGPHPSFVVSSSFRARSWTFVQFTVTRPLRRRTGGRGGGLRQATQGPRRAHAITHAQAHVKRQEDACL